MDLFILQPVVLWVMFLERSSACFSVVTTALEVCSWALEQTYLVYIIALTVHVVTYNPQTFGVQACSHFSLRLTAIMMEGTLNVQLLPSLRHPAHSSGCPVGLAQHQDTTMLH